jgi:hypothetical protein
MSHPGRVAGHTREMTTFLAMRLTHILFAVLGAGAVGSIAIAARAALASQCPPTLLLPLTRLAASGLGGTLLTAIALDVGTDGAYHAHWWFRLAGLSVIATGVLVGVIRRRASRAASEPAALRGTPPLAYAACALVAWLTVLMVLKPFG